MSYRVDIPTLSANEVYTLTFEYEGTETIQLIVGDLTLETTDRRVVFTTTSPVNYIESNVNLTNLNMYEGYYESDDFGGEYTQESYIEGKSLINIFPPSSPKTLAQGHSLDFDETTGLITITFVNNTNNFNCTARAYGLMKYLKPSTDYTFVIDILENSLVDADGNASTNLLYFFNTTAYLYPDTQQPFSGGFKGDVTNSNTPTIEGSVGRYLCGIRTVDTFLDTMSADMVLYTVAYNGTLKAKIMVLEGDYTESGIETNWFPQGIGCVKSPRVISREQPLNMFYCTDWTSTLNNGTVTCQDGKFYFDGSFGGYTWFDIINGGEVKNNIYLEPGMYYAKMKAHSKEPCVVTGMCVSVEATMENGTTIELCGVYTSKDKIYSGVTSAYKEFTSPIVKLSLKIWYGGDGNNKIIIDGIYFSKTNMGDDLSFKENHAVVTPDDLELYDVYYGNGHSIQKQDKLDLTTGIVTRNVCKWKLNDYLSSNLNYWNFREWNKKDETTNEYVRIQIGALYNPYGNPTLARGWSEVYGLYFDYWEGDYGAAYFYDGATYFYTTSGGVFFMCSKAQILSWTGVESYELLTTQIIYDWFMAGDFTIMNVLSEPTTEQLSLNPLKSYRNGSIQTSSQQLTPTLKTTLPVSNKFTTTNLTSGSTYNVYFDGTATKLDAGGTIITNPISPCEVECGGTTLTIEGTDIQNVRVIETTIKNEVGSVVGTTDVELSKVKTANSPSDSLISTKIEYWEQTTEYGNALRHVLPIQVKPNTKYILNTTNTQRLFAIWDANRNELVLQNIYVNSPYIWTTPADCPSEVYLYLVYQTDVNRAHLDELRMFEGEIDFGYQGQQEPLISQTISTLEQPIKLRSLGTTYDSYNPVTSELTKRIGVSETDGSYSVLSSPIVIPPKYKMLQDNNIILDSFPQVMHSPYIDFLPTQLLPNTTYTVFLDATTAVGQLECGLLYNGDWYDGMKKFTVGVQSFVYTTNNQVDRFGGFRIRGQGSIINNLIMVQGEYSLDFYNPITSPHLYTNGQVKVYSDSDVYPTTILNGQSTNNYEINELNTSNNYTIRYEGKCESINLANKSNTQGNNTLITAGATSGDLTFVNGIDIDNVLLTQGDVREQEINHFNGLQTVEVSRMLIETSQNMWWNDWIEPSQYDTNLFVDSADYIQVNGGETIYIVANSNTYYSIIEFDENYTRINFSNTLIGNKQQQPVVKNGYYKNFLKLRDNTKYIKFVAPKSTALNQTSNPTFTFSIVEFDEPILSINTPYQRVYIDLPQPVQLNSLPDGTCDTYNPITGEYVQNVGVAIWSDIKYISREAVSNDKKWASYWLKLNGEAGGNSYSALYTIQNSEIPVSSNIPSINQISYAHIASRANTGGISLRIPIAEEGIVDNKGTGVIQWLKDNDIHMYYKLDTKITTPITTQLTPIEIPTFEGGILQLITTDGKVFPMVEYSMATNNRYDTSSWEAGAVYTQRNMTEAYFNESTTPMIPTETMTLTTDHISSGSIILNDNGNGLIVLKGNYTGRDIPYFTGMRSVEAIEVETTPSPEQPLFGKGGRK